MHVSRLAGGSLLPPQATRRAAPGFPTWMLPVLALLALTGTLPPGPQAVAVLAAIILIGIPHGALDGEIARPLLRPRFGRAWFLVFALPYLGLAAFVFLAWRLTPFATLAAFLAASVWHFGCEDAGHNPLEAATRGGLPIALPVLLHPAVTAQVFGKVAMAVLAQPPGWLTWAACVWCLAAASWVLHVMVTRQWPSLLEPAALALLFVALPPLTAFAAYFICFHAPRHMTAVVANGSAPRVCDMAAAVWWSLPLTGLTILIGAGLWRWFPGAAPDRLLTLTIQGLAALTLPHLLLDQLAATYRKHTHSTVGCPADNTGIGLAPRQSHIEQRCVSCARMKLGGWQESDAADKDADRQRHPAHRLNKAQSRRNRREAQPYVGTFQRSFGERPCHASPSSISAATATPPSRPGPCRRAWPQAPR